VSKTANPPYIPFHPNPSKPRFKVPAGAVDSHCHVFGPAARFAYAPERKYTPVDAPKEKLFALRDYLGFDKNVIVQASCHGKDNSALIDALVNSNNKARGIAVVGEDVTARELKVMDEAGVRGVRFNFVKRLVDFTPRDVLESIAELFRAVMADTRKLVPLEQEIELCRNYVEIEQTRLGNRLAVDWQIGAYHPRAKVPQLLLQPVIENAIRYGAEKLPGKADIVVRVRQHGFVLEIYVSNPIAPERPEREGNQIGLANIRGRLALIYDLEAKVETQMRRDRFELTMTLPVERRT